MKLTPEILAAAYNYLRSTPPFCRWDLPEGQWVRFHIDRSPNNRATCWNDGNWHIKMSERLHSHTYSVMQTMAHEMCHMKDTGPAHHGKEFHRIVNLVCRHHGFDPAAF